jgi:hypothetical protein
MKARSFAALVLAVVAGGDMAKGQTPGVGLRFEVTVGPDLAPRPRAGRLFVVLGNRPRPEPRRILGQVVEGSPPAVARDVDRLDPEHPAVLDASCSSFPIEDLGRLPAGHYHVQAVLASNADSRRLDAPGNLYGDPVDLDLDPRRDRTIRLELTHQVPPERLPADTDRVKYLKLPSKVLSEFHGRPMFVRAGVILPRGFDREPGRRYPLRVHIGGYGTPYTTVGPMMGRASAFRAAWDADAAPRFVLLHLDGDGPLGDPYQVDSANHGPYGRALMEELIPEVERQFGCGGDGRSRVLDGGSTGGWVALALQVFYPDAFAGAWGFCPDPVDFRSFQKVNIYDDENAYTAPDGGERPSARKRDGTVMFTMRRECAMENLLGAGDSYTRSGGQWGAWNATFSPRGVDGQPVPLWDPKSGAIDRGVAEHWKQYDLRLILERDGRALAPKLAGKLRIWVGEADTYYLNEAVHHLDQSLKEVDSPLAVSLIFGPGEGHCWMGIAEPELLRQMAEACGVHRAGSSGGL